MKHEVESLEREIGTLRAETGRLTATVNRLRTDPDFIEQVAREDLGPGEAGRAGAQAAAVPGAERALARVDIIPFLFFVALFFNIRASIKLALDWRGMLITTRFVRDAYARLGDLPTEERLEREPDAPVFLHLVPAYHEPDIAVTVGALTASRYPHGRLHVVVVTKEEEERAPHPAMGVSTGELVRRLRETLPPYQQKRLSHVVMPGPGRKAHQLNWALRPEVLREILTEETDPRRVFVGVSDADSIPDPDTYRWIAQRELGGQGSLAYQGIPLSLANYDRLPIRGKICAIQQSSIFIRVSIARLLNEVKRVRLLARLTARAPRLAWLVRPAFELFFRRSQICLGHNQFVRLDLMQAVGGFPTSGATEDSTLGYELGRRGVLIQALPMVEVTDLPETSEGVIRQNARWYLGVLDDIPFLWRVWRTRAHRLQPGPARAAHRQQGGGVADRGAGLPGHRLARLVSGLPPRGPPLLVLHGHRRADRLAAPDGVGGRHHDPGADRGSAPVPAAPGGPAPQEPEGEVPRHLPLPDLLAARHARRLARALGPGPHRPLRAGQDRPRHRPPPLPLPSGERAG